jgi:hypothetical protein
MIQFLKNLLLLPVDPLAIWLYYLPASICLVVYFIRTAREYRLDYLNSSKDYYRPELTVGLILGRLLAALLPTFNIFAVVFNCSGSIFAFIEKVFNMPLVPKKKKPE